MGKSIQSGARSRPRRLILLVGFGIVLPGAILGGLSLSGLEGDRLARERLHEEKHRRVADRIAFRLEESVEEVVEEIETRVARLLEGADGIPAIEASMDRLGGELPSVYQFFLVSQPDCRLLLPRTILPAEEGPVSAGEIRRSLEKVLLRRDVRDRAEDLLLLYGKALRLKEGDLAALCRDEVALRLVTLIDEEGPLEEVESRFRALAFRDRYVREICDQLIKAHEETAARPLRWRTAARKGKPILYGTHPLRGHDPPYLLGYVLDQDRITDAVLPRILASAMEKGLRIAVRDQEGNPLAGVPAGDFLATSLSLGMGLPHWTIEVGADRAEFERRHRWRRGILLGLITFLALSIFAGAGWTIRGIAREREAGRQKSDFVASVSHELRTPLTSIRMFAEMLRSGRARGPEKQLEYARFIARESERLGALIDNVLDFSRLEAGGATFEMAPAPIGEVVRKATDHFREHLLEDGFELDVRIEMGLPTLPVDSDGISRAIQNLVGNAVKYSDSDKRIFVRAIRAAGEVRIEVEDHGPGIPEVDRERIFEKFQRGQQSGPPGCGLGLAIVRAILEGHGGEVRLSSREGEGSTFTLVLPDSPPGGTTGRTLGPVPGGPV